MKKVSRASAKNYIARGLHISHLTKAQQEKIVAMLMESVAARMNVAIWSNFSDVEKNELKKMLQKASEKKVLDYISSRVNNFSGLTEDITRQTIADFRKRRSEMIKG